MCQQTLVPTAPSLGLTPGHLRGDPGPQLGGAGLRRSGVGEHSQCRDHSQFKGLIKQWVKVLLVLLGLPGGQLRELMPGFQGQLDKGVAGTWQVAREGTLAKDDTPSPECSPHPSSGALPASTASSRWSRGNAPSAQELGGTRAQTRRAAGAASTHRWSPGAADWRR